MGIFNAPRVETPFGEGRWICWRDHYRAGNEWVSQPRALPTFGAYLFDQITHHQSLMWWLTRVGFVDVPTKVDGGIAAWRWDFWNSWMAGEMRRISRERACAKQARENAELHRTAAKGEK